MPKDVEACHTHPPHMVDNSGEHHCLVRSIHPLAVNSNANALPVS